MKKKILCITIVLLNLLITIGYAANVNKVLNYGFEQGAETKPFTWEEEVWDKKPGVTLFDWDVMQVHSGKRSVKITNVSQNDSRYIQSVRVEADSFYKISCWIKTEKVDEKNKGANISIKGLLDTSEDVKGTSDWRKVQFYGKTSSNQFEFPLTLGIGGYGTTNIGTAWFDDVEVVKVPETEIPLSTKIVNLYKVEEEASKNSKSAIVIPALLIILLIAFTIFIIVKSKEYTLKNGKLKIADGNRVTGETRLILDKQDFIIMVIMTLVYLGIAIFNLGSTAAPKTSWTPSRAGESFVIDMKKEVDISKLYYFKGLGDGSVIVEYMDKKGEFVFLSKTDLTDLFKWKYLNITKRTSKIKIIINKPGMTINELALFKIGEKVPTKDFSIIEKNLDSHDLGKLNNAFDEQDTVDYNHTYLTGMVFDEIYHVKTAFENINFIEPTETSHPPLGKLFIALGILIFGMDPFGWRIIGTLFGAAMIPLLYIFAKKMFAKRFFAFCAAFLLMFDFMHFVQTRTALIDAYATFFIILMYYYMYDYVMNKSYETSFKASLKPLFLSGLFFGLGAASKWIALYAAGGLAFLFFYAKFKEYKDYKNLVHKKNKASWTENFLNENMLLTILWCVLFFIIIPVAIYLLSYIPYLMVNGASHNLSDVIDYQKHMFNYHNNLVADHPFKSKWYTWPFDYKPIWFYSGSDLPNGIVSTISSFGNPAVWWLGAITMPVAAIISWRKKDKKMLVVFTAILFQYIPWIFISRVVFIYHYFSIVPFMIISIVYVFKYYMEKIPMLKYPILVYLLLVLLLFVLFYPVLSGMEVSKSYIENYLRWFKNTWFF